MKIDVRHERTHFYTVGIIFPPRNDDESERGLSERGSEHTRPSSPQARLGTCPSAGRASFPPSQEWQRRNKIVGSLAVRFAALLILACGCIVGFGSGVAQASIAYGSINNFDTVNDTGVPCHGFEIELDDIHRTDITYTYDWNHYGTPTITEDNSDPLHPKVFVRYAAMITNGVWTAYTAVPAGPIPPTQGHQFTDPSTNFGGEHFGVGYRAAPTAVKYNWLIDGGFGNLVYGGAVNVATPTFTYFPPAGGAAAQVQAAIVPPPPPAPPMLEFGEASWVKEIRTTTHNNSEVKLRHLVDPDPDDPRKDWRNGEPDEVEVEWQLLQTEFNAANGGANGELKGAPEPLENGDEVVTRRYEFYEYVGPLDGETGEAKAGSVGPDGIHGTGNYSNDVVVGKFLGAQMSAYDVDAPIGLIDHLCDGEVGVEYDTRTIVIAGTTSFVATTSGSLPDGMIFDVAKGELSGTPNVSGVFIFNVHVTSSNSPAVSKAYPFMIAAPGEVLPPHSCVDVSASSADAGSAEGTGVYEHGSTVIVAARPKLAFDFVNWMDNGKVVSSNASYQFTAEINRSLVANFATSTIPRLEIQSVTNAVVLTWSTNFPAFALQENATLGTTNWMSATNVIKVVGDAKEVTVSPPTGTRFFRLHKP